MLVTQLSISPKKQNSKNTKEVDGWELSPWSFGLPDVRTDKRGATPMTSRNVIKWKGGSFLGVYTEREIRFHWIAYIRIYHRRLPELLRFLPGLFLSLHPTSPRCRNGLRDSAEIVDLSRFPRRGMAHLRLLASLFFFPTAVAPTTRKTTVQKKKKKTIQRDESKRTKWLETRLLFAFDYRSASKWQTIHSLTHANTIINRTHTAHKCVCCYKLPFVLKCTTNTTHIPPNPRNRNK